MINLEYTLRNCTYNDFDLIFELKKLCMKWYIEIIYGWDEEDQTIKTKNEIKRNIDNMQIIEVNGKNIGITTFIKNEESYRVGLIMIHPDYQNKGLATSIITNYINVAKNENKRIVIKTYKNNPAKNLYQRLGFKIYDTDETHIHLEIDFSK